MSEALPSPAALPVRVAARAVDVVVLVLLQAGLGGLMGFGYDWLVLGAVSVLAYFVVFDVAASGTPGKRLLGLRVLGPGGEKPTAAQAVIREAFMVLGAIPFAGPLLAFAAWVWIAVTIQKSPQRQGKHDLLAGGTRVVRVN